MLMAWPAACKVPGWRVMPSAARPVRIAGIRIQLADDDFLLKLKVGRVKDQARLPPARSAPNKLENSNDRPLSKRARRRPE